MVSYSVAEATQNSPQDKSEKWTILCRCRTLLFADKLWNGTTNYILFSYIRKINDSEQKTEVAVGYVFCMA